MSIRDSRILVVEEYMRENHHFGALPGSSHFPDLVSPTMVQTHQLWFRLLQMILLLRCQMAYFGNTTLISLFLLYPVLPLLPLPSDYWCCPKNISKIMFDVFLTLQRVPSQGLINLAPFFKTMSTIASLNSIVVYSVSSSHKQSTINHICVRHHV